MATVAAEPIDRADILPFAMADPLSPRSNHDQRATFEPGLPTSQPPRLRSTLVGREAELHVIAEMLARDDLPLLTLSGPGGVGKTRLAIETGIRAAPTFRDGVVYVALD